MSEVTLILWTQPTTSDTVGMFTVICVFNGRNKSNQTLPRQTSSIYWTV